MEAKSNKLKKKVAILLTVCFILSISAAAVSAAVGNPNPGVLPINSHYQGKTYGEWGAQWWKWIYSIPVSSNPLYAEGKYDASIGQSGNVWFLAGTLVKHPGTDATFPPITRTCTIPAGKALFFPIINSEASVIEGYGTTEKQLHDSAKSDIDKVSLLQVTVDGKSLKNLYKYRAESSLFKFTLPKNDVLGLGPGSSYAVTDGYWIMLMPLPAGKHTIRIHGEVHDYKLDIDVTYELTVKKENKIGTHNC